MRPGGDVNEDDVPDVLIGFPLAGTRTDGRNEAGVTYAVYGQAATGPDRALETIPGQFGARVVAPVVHDHGGTSPAPVGWSVSPDEAGVLIGAPGAGFRTGAAYVVRSSQFAGDDRSARGESSEELTDAAGFRCSYKRRKEGYILRDRPFCYTRGKDHPDFRVAAGWDKHNRNRKDRLDKRLGNGRERSGNARIGLKQPLARGRHELLDSLGSPVLEIEQDGPHRFTFYEPGGPPEGREVKRSGAHLEVVGHACMKRRADVDNHVMIALKKVGEYFGFRGFIDKRKLPSLPAKTRARIDRTRTTCGNGRRLYGSQKTQARRHPTVGTLPHQIFRDRVTEEMADPANARKKDHELELELYQGINAVSKGGADAGEELSNYFEPRVIANANRTLDRRRDTAFVTIATTGVRGGGLVRAVVRTAQARNPTPFRQLDRMLYTDTNVPCNNRNPKLLRSVCCPLDLRKLQSKPRTRQPADRGERGRERNLRLGAETGSLLARAAS